MPPFTELAARSHYSFLEGSASPRTLVAAAAALGIEALGLCDRNGLYGAVGFMEAARVAGIRAIIGVDLDLDGGDRLHMIARHRGGYRQLCRAISAAQLAGVKGQPRLRLAGLDPAVATAAGVAAPRRRRPTLPPPERPAALRPTAGPFPRGWPGLPSTTLLAEGEPATVDPADLDGCTILAGGPESAITTALVRGDLRDATRRAEQLRDLFGRDRIALLISHHRHPGDSWLAAQMALLARRTGLPLAASGLPVHANHGDKPLLDVLTAIRHRTTLDNAAAHGLLLPNAEHRLRSEAELRGLLADHPEAFDVAAHLAMQCDVELDFTESRFPGFPVPPGETPFSVLYRLCQESVQRKYAPVTRAVAARLQRELDVIEKTNLAEFFLITWDIMRFAREQHIPGQGRGSAADSIVAYLLDITRVDPVAHDLLFERFLHEDHQGTPDIDIDFSTDHREQVLQYVYDRYGADRTGMVANVVTFRPRMAMRQVGAAMGFPEPLIDRLAKSVDGWEITKGELRSPLGHPPASGVGSGDMKSPAPTEALPWKQFYEVLQQIEGTPRHLGIHVGGMLVTGEPLVDVAPVERATMPGRVVVQFNKDDVEDLGLIKMDLLGLRTLSAIAECLDLIEQSTGVRPDLDALPLDDPAVYASIQKVDTIGLFQIESRAQQQSLWQSQPREFNDLIVQVAIIRPGPIQGDAVNPYLRRRQGLEPVTYLHPSLEPILAETMGVVLYQEQILRIVMEVAGYTAGQADRFRRAMNRHRSRVEMEELRDEFVGRCNTCSGMPVEVAAQIFKGVAGFAQFGFCKSHAAAFARTAYETAWLRLHHPAAYVCALLNAQPMGFYHPSVLVEDAKRHGVRFLPVDVTRSRARCTLENGEVRLGFNYMKALGPTARIACEEAAMAGATSLRDFWRHTLLPRRAMENLVLAGAFDAVERGRHRRELLWELKQVEESLPPRTAARREAGAEAPGATRRPPRGRGAVAGSRLGDEAHAVRRLDTDPPPPLLEVPAAAPPLPVMDERTRVLTEYALSEVSTGRHLLSFIREQLTSLGCRPLATIRDLADGTRVRVAGLVIARQAPASASGFRFFTLADEDAHLDLIFRPDVVARTRRVANHNPLLMVEGRLQNERGRVNVVVEAVTGLDGDGVPLQQDDFAPVRGAPPSHDYR